MNDITRPTLTKQRLAREMGRRTRLTNKQAEVALGAMIAILSEQIASGGRVELTNFLTLEVRPLRRLAAQSSFWHTTSGNEGSAAICYVLRCRPGKRLRIALRKLSLLKSQGQRQ